MKHDIKDLITGFQKAVENKDKAGITKFYSSFAEYEDELLNIEKISSDLAHREKDLSQEVSELKSQLMEMEAKGTSIESLSELIEEKGKEKELLEDENNKIKADIEICKGEIDRLMAEIKETTESNKELEKERDKISDEIANLQYRGGEPIIDKLDAMNQSFKIISKNIVNASDNIYKIYIFLLCTTCIGGFIGLCVYISSLFG
jgi:chromosome segregation ATPase